MYRLMSSANLTLNNVLLSTRQAQVSSKTGHIQNSIWTRPSYLTNVSSLKNYLKPKNVRFQTNGPTAEDIPARSKKIRKPKYAKFIELLEVTNSSSKQTKRKVKRLSANKFQEFINKAHSTALTTSNADGKKLPFSAVSYEKYNVEMLDTRILESGLYDDKPLIFLGKRMDRTFDSPEEIDGIMKSFKTFREIIEGHDNEEHEGDLDAVGYSTSKIVYGEPRTVESLDSIEEDVLQNITKSTESTRTSKKGTKTTKEHRFKSKNHRSEEQERLAKESALRINLTTYLNVCVSAGMVNRGLSTLVSYRQRSKKSSNDKSSLRSVDLYNILMHGYASKGQFDKIKDILGMLQEDNVACNHQSFAAILEALGRMEKNAENVQLIRSYLQQAEEMGITPNAILDESKFQYDQREIVLHAIRRMQPDFVPVYTPPVLTYDNALLNDLNAQVRDPLDNSPPKAGSEIMNSKQGYTQKQLEEFARNQLKIELDGSITVKSIEKSKEFANSGECRKKVDELQSHWRSQICAAINRDLSIMRAQCRFKPQGYMTYYTYLKTLEPAQYAEILLKEIRMLSEGSETYSPTVSMLYRELGQKVHARYIVEQKKSNGLLDKIGEVYSDYCEEWERCSSSDNPRQTWQRLVHHNRHTGPSMDINEIVWPNNVLTGVGRFLYNILMRDIKIDAHIMRGQTKSKTQNMLPAFYTLFRNQGRIVKEEVKPHPVLARLMRASRQKTLTFDSNLVPMLCPPQPWSTPVNGGYLLTKSELIRLPHQAVQQWSRINEAKDQQLFPPLDSLNQLSSVPWRVNTQILDVMVHVFQNGGDNKLDVPQPPSSLPALPSIPANDPNVSNAERAKAFRDKLGHRRKQAEMYSLWCDTLYRLSLANHYRDKVFWLPHNMDFRGRVYPIPPHLNHLGSDLARSILIFDQAQPLGKDGFSWLKLHCINLTGLKKRDSVRERLLYAEEIMDDILDSADNPLEGRRWWVKSDEPWQTLACCMEIANVLRSGDPENYMSRFPIHQDGSCNGLQHYAALGRDKAGANSVNLSPAPIPQDVYSAVAGLVEKMRTNDANNGLEVAKVLGGFVRRKVIKQTVMTTVYGVTRYGARLQIARQLKDLDDFPKEWVWPASTYLTAKTFESLREMFTSTREIQDWFTECARLISGVCAQNVEWCTPLGLPVVQPYNRSEQKHSNKPTHRVSEVMSMDMYEKPNVMKQKNAFPPNFIHSLDSSHMMLTSLHCERRGLTFVSVHDCYWTHACTVPDMNKICREQFVALHSQPILEDLSNFLMQKFSYTEKDFANDGSAEDLTKKKLNRMLKQLPQKGDFDLRNVLDSVYFFS